LRTTLLPSYNELLTQLLALLRRSIPAQALTALLATLSVSFKYLLIPSTNNTDAAQTVDHDGDDDLLKATWKQILRSLPRCNVEVQRAVGEVWGVGILRRVKGKERERTVGFLIEGEGEGMQGKGVQDFCAWCVVSACKVRTLYFLSLEVFWRFVRMSLWVILAIPSYTISTSIMVGSEVRSGFLNLTSTDLFAFRLASEGCLGRVLCCSPYLIWFNLSSLVYLVHIISLLTSTSSFNSLYHRLYTPRPRP
jgi:hypothetical protein